MQHLSTSLGKLVQNLLHGGPGELKLIQDYIDTEHGGDETKFDLLTRKGVYPYSYIDGVEKFAEGIVVLSFLVRIMYHDLPFPIHFLARCKTYVLMSANCVNTVEYHICKPALNNDFTGLPEQSEFHNDLTSEPLSDEDYEHVQEVWNAFELDTLGDLHDL